MKKSLMTCCLLAVFLMTPSVSAENWVAVPKTPEEQRHEQRINAEIQNKRQQMDQDRKARLKQYHQEKATERAAADSEQACSSAQSKGTKMVQVVKACGQPLAREQEAWGGGRSGSSVSIDEIWHYDGFGIRFINGKVYRVFSE